jgi:3-phenylpropionate/trans-cinnamate dioxygenase ferredoxin reductase component
VSTPRSIVIVGASLTGAKAAETLRDEGYDGRLVLLGAEPERPYERPPLSKDYLRGQVAREKAYVHEAGFYDERGIELRTGTEVAAIDPAGRTVTLAGGERLSWDRLLLAVGAEPRRLPLPGADLEGHDLDDVARALEDEGVKTFPRSFQSLREGLREKRSLPVHGIGPRECLPGR